MTHPASIHEVHRVVVSERPLLYQDHMIHGFGEERNTFFIAGMCYMTIQEKIQTRKVN